MTRGRHDDENTTSTTHNAMSRMVVAIHVLRSVRYGARDVAVVTAPPWRRTGRRMVKAELASAESRLPESLRAPWEDGGGSRRKLPTGAAGRRKTTRPSASV